MTIYHLERGTRAPEAASLEALLASSDRLGFTAATWPTTGRPQCWAVASESDAFVVNARAWPLDEPSLRTYLEDRSRVKVVHDGTQHAALLASCGVQLAGVFDTHAVARLLVTGLSVHVLASLGLGSLDLAELSSVLLGVGLDPARISGGQAAARGLARRVTLVRRVGDLLAEEVAVAGLGRAARLESATALVLGRMALRGLTVDAPRWRSICQRGFDEAVYAERRLADALGMSQDDRGAYIGFAAGAAEALAPRLSALLGTTLTSTSDEALEGLSHPAVVALRVYRAGRALAHWASVPDKGALRPSWVGLGTVTGRVTSRAPNVQGMPRALRAAVVGPEGSVLGAFDFGRQEPYVLAAESGDTALADDLATGDPYERIGFEVGIDRAVAKSAMLAVAYGISVRELARRCRISDAQARALRGSLLATYPRAMAFGRSVTVDSVPDAGQGLLAAAHGVRQVRTRWRRRLVAGTLPSRLSLGNTPIQATGADMVKAAMVTVERSLAEQIPGAYPVGTIHDELLVVAPVSASGLARDIVIEAMTDAARRCLPAAAAPPVAGDFGESWAQAH